MLTNSAPSFAGIPQRQEETWCASVISGRSNFMQLPELARSTTLQWTLLVAGLFAGFIVALLGFVYLKTKADLTAQSDRMIASQIVFLAHLSPERRLNAIDEHLEQDPRRVRLAGLFGPNGRRIAGNLKSLPPKLKTYGAVQGDVVDMTNESGGGKKTGQPARAHISHAA